MLIHYFRDVLKVAQLQRTITDFLGTDETSCKHVTDVLSPFKLI